jgi:hypothetical protein
MKYLAFILVLFVSSAAMSAELDYRFTGGITSDLAPGAAMPAGSTLYKMDVGINLRSRWWMDLFWDREAYLTGIYNEGNWSGGLGVRLRSGYHITDNWRIFIGGGVLTLIDGGDIDNLGHSILYGSIEGGLEYKSLTIGFNHVSSPFHDGSDGDRGFNDLYFGVQINY